MLTKPPSQAEFEECWSEAIIKNGLSPSVVDDPLFRKPSDVSHIHWVDRGTGTPKDKDEVNTREVSECDV
jgi:hypothetical protein